MKSNNLEKLLIENFQQFINHWKNTNREGILADTLIVSISDGYKRAKVITPTINKGDMIEKDGQRILEMLLSKLEWATSHFDNDLKWMRIEWVTTEKEFTWKDFNQELRRYKRNYFRSGIAFEGKTKPWCLLTEMELNANACLYAGNDVSYAKANLKNLNKYIKSRHSSNNLPSFDDEMTLIVFNTEGVFLDASTGEFIEIESKPRNKGRRIMLPLNSDSIQPIISQSACYLANQVQPTGKYVYGYFPCFNRTINTYNALRHASSTYALIEGYEACKKFNILSVQQLEEMLSQIDNALDYTANTLIRTYGYKSYVVDTGDEIKLGANAVAILAFVKYIQVFPNNDKTERYLSIANKLALGILDMQQDDGSFVHVLHSKDLTLKQKNRIIYYDGEAAFALMRLYGLTKDERWLNCVEKAFDYFIEAKHYRAHDHWLSYCSNELVLYKPERKYFQFAVDNIKGYTDFIKNRITTFPTLLELSMAFHKMLLKLDDYPEYHDVLEGFDVHDFYQALHARANYLLNGFFFPEVAMFFKAPNTILHGFFIRHHSFRVRIDDVEHYLSGLIAYAELLEEGQYPSALQSSIGSELVESLKQAQIIDRVNIGMLRTGSKPGYRALAMAYIGQHNGIEIYFFGIDDVNVETKKINAKKLVDNRWVDEIIDYPVIIDNDVALSLRNKAIFDHLAKNSYLTTQVFGGKLKTLKLLSDNNIFSECLIPQVVIKSKHDFISFIHKYNSSVLKPIRGSQGNNIYFITIKDSSLYVNHEGNTKEVINLDKFYDDVIKGRNFLIQKYITSTTIQGSPFDIRVHVQRNADNKWQNTKTYIRVGTGERLTANISTGGAIANAVPFIKNTYGEKSKKVLNKINEIAKKLPDLFQQFYTKEIDALGIDLGVDKEGNVWIFEINSFPGTKFFYLEEAIIRIGYLKYLYNREAKRE